MEPEQRRRYGFWLSGTMMAMTFMARGAWAEDVVTGTATYREWIALPPDAMFEAMIEDVSRADAPADIIAPTRVEPPGQAPIRFQLSYDSSKVDEHHAYSVRGRITARGHFFITSH
jgi:putative lipoprotein